MKCGDIKKFEYKFYGGTKVFIGVVCEVKEGELIVFTTDAARFTLYTKNILACTTTRSIPAETRSLLTEYYKLYAKMKAERERHQKVIKPLEDAMKKIDAKTLRNSMGLLSKEQFVNEFMKNLPSPLAKAIESFECEIYGEQLTISCWKNIEKYFRKGSFVYEEYDGTIQLCSNCEKDKNYQAYVKKYQVPLPVKQKPQVYLSIGDKDWLICHTQYDIMLKKKLTADYAKELAEKFAGR